MPPGESTGVQDFGPISAGVHALGVQAEGTEGGCNSGSIASWSGTLTLTVSGVTDVDAAVAAPGDTVSVSTVTTGSPAPAAVEASYTRPLDAVGFGSLSAATYSPGDPIVPSNPVNGSIAFVDLRLVGSGANDVLQARFTAPQPVSPSDVLRLVYFDGTRWSLVSGTDGVTVAFDGSGFSITFTDTSTPKLTDLGGTVFAFVAATPGDCTVTPVGATFASVACRLAALGTQTESANPVGRLGTKLLALLGKATTRTQSAQSHCASGVMKPAKAGLEQMVRALAQYGHRLHSHAARDLVASVRDSLSQTADGIRSDATRLRGDLRCPDDATVI
jgi:hypothetical protein